MKPKVCVYEIELLLYLITKDRLALYDFSQSNTCSAILSATTTTTKRRKRAATQKKNSTEFKFDSSTIILLHFIRYDSHLCVINISTTEEGEKKIRPET